MSPFGGKPTRRPDKERMDAMRTFFKNGRLEQEVVQTYASPDLVVLAVIEHAHGEVGTLAPQDWGCESRSSIGASARHGTSRTGMRIRSRTASASSRPPRSDAATILVDR